MIAFRNSQKTLLSLFIGALFLLGGCGKQQAPKEEMPLEDLKGKVVAELNGKKSERAIEYLEELINRYPENSDIAEYKLMLADLYLKTGSLDAAYELYKNYNKMYPGEQKAEYAMYKAVLSKFYQTLKISHKCDQSDTEKTLKLCHGYLGNPMYHEYRGDVKDIHYTCERRLIDKEVYVFNSYLVQARHRPDRLKSAQNRLKFLKERFLPKHKTLEPQLLYLECKLAQRQNDTRKIQENVESLMHDHNESQFTRMAMGLANKAFHGNDTNVRNFV
jgi:outer membrane protein assembly factor BamD